MSVTFGGGGRDIVGRVVIEGGDPDDVDWTRDFHQLNLVLDPPPTFGVVDSAKPMTPAERQAFWAEQRRREMEYLNGPEARAYERAAKNYVLEFQTNGDFRVTGVLPGTYDLSIAPTDASRDSSSQTIGNLSQRVVVPEPSGPEADTPIDLGTLKITTRGVMRVGKRAPTFALADFDGARVSLADFKGRYVVLHFWATWSTAAAAELQNFRTLHEAYAADRRVALLSLNFDSSQDVAREIVRSTLGSQRSAWPQVYAGPWGDANLIQSGFGLQGLPETMLVGPDGIVVAMGLRGPAIRRSIEGRLPPLDRK